MSDLFLRTLFWPLRSQFFTMPRYPDEVLGRVNCDLEDFIDRAEALWDEACEHYADGSISEPPFDNPERWHSFVRFILAGRAETAEGQCRLYVNPLYDAAPLRPDEYKLSRDFDSIIGICRSFPFTCGMSFYPIPNFSYTMTQQTTNHLPFDIPVGPPPRHGQPDDRQRVRVLTHHIPNIMFGKLDRLNSQTYVFFPSLYRHREPPRITTEELRIFYDKCVRPALEVACGERLSHWPLSYDVAGMNRDNRQHYIFHSEPVPCHRLETFSTELLSNMARHRFHDAFFLHEIKGIKNLHFHDPKDLADTEHAFDEALSFLDHSLLDGKSWWVDVAMEVYDPTQKHVLHWRSDARASLLEIGLPSASQERLERLANSTSLKVDVVAQVYPCAGFRGSPQGAGREDGVVWLNVYSTDKAPTYNFRHTGYFRRHQPKELLPEGIDTVLRDIRMFTRIFNRCLGNPDMPGGDGENPLPGAPHDLEEGAASQPGAARYEVRVTLDKVATTLLDIPHAKIARGIRRQVATNWWAYKYWRSLGICYVLHHLHTIRYSERVWHETLQLGAIMIYMMNALIYRPGDHSWDHPLVENCAFWLFESDDYFDLDEADDEHYPMLAQRGVYFLSDILLDDNRKCLRLPSVRILSPNEFAAVYHQGSFAALVSSFGQNAWNVASHVQQPPSRRAFRMQNRGMTPNLRVVAPHIFSEPAPRTPLSEMGIVPRHLPRPSGPDVLPWLQPNPSAGRMLGAGQDLDTELRDIERQLTFDWLALSPNQSNGSAYITMTTQEMMEATSDIFKQHVLPFFSVNIRLVSATVWNRLVCQAIPDKGSSQPLRSTGRRTSAGFQALGILLNNLNSQDAALAVSWLRSRIRERVWTSYSESERLWRAGTPPGLQWVHLSLQPDRVTGVNIAVRSDAQIPLSAFRLRPPTRELTLADALINPPVEDADDATHEDADDLGDGGDEREALIQIITRLEDVVAFEETRPRARHNVNDNLNDLQDVPHVIRLEPSPHPFTPASSPNPFLPSSLDQLHSPAHALPRRRPAGTPEPFPDMGSLSANLPEPLPGPRPHMLPPLPQGNQDRPGHRHGQKRPARNYDNDLEDEERPRRKRQRLVLSEDDEDEMVTLPLGTTVGEYLSSADRRETRNAAGSSQQLGTPQRRANPHTPAAGLTTEWNVPVLTPRTPIPNPFVRQSTPSNTSYHHRQPSQDNADSTVRSPSASLPFGFTLGSPFRSLSARRLAQQKRTPFSQAGPSQPSRLSPSGSALRQVRRGFTSSGERHTSSTSNADSSSDQSRFTPVTREQRTALMEKRGAPGVLLGTQWKDRHIFTPAQTRKTPVSLSARQDAPRTPVSTFLSPLPWPSARSREDNIAESHSRQQTEQSSHSQQPALHSTYSPSQSFRPVLQPSPFRISNTAPKGSSSSASIRSDRCVDTGKAVDRSAAEDEEHEDQDRETTIAGPRRKDKDNVAAVNQRLRRAVLSERRTPQRKHQSTMDCFLKPRDLPSSTSVNSLAGSRQRTSGQMAGPFTNTPCLTPRSKFQSPVYFEQDEEQEDEEQEDEEQENESDYE